MAQRFSCCYSLERNGGSRGPGGSVWLCSPVVLPAMAGEVERKRGKVGLGRRRIVLDWRCSHAGSADYGGGPRTVPGSHLATFLGGRCCSIPQGPGYLRCSPVHGYVHPCALVFDWRSARRKFPGIESCEGESGAGDPGAELKENKSRRHSRTAMAFMRK